MQKIKTWTKDHWRLLFKSAADNHMRIQQCHEGADGSLRCDIRFASYLELKRYQKKLRRATVSLASAIAMVMVALIVSPYIFNPSGSQAGSFQWVQTAWNGTADSTPALKSGETDYASKDTAVDTTTSVGDAKLALSAVINVTETNDADFTGTKTDADGTYVNGTGKLFLRKPYLAACAGTPATECVANNTCASNFCKKANGQSCTLADGSECACGVCTSNVCTPPPPCGVGVTNLVDVRPGETITYPVVNIDTQCWMAENLRTTKKPDGTDITASAYCNPAGCGSPWGRLYTLATVLNGSLPATSTSAKIQGICPTGWHIPSDYNADVNDDWQKLSNFLGGDAIAGGKMKRTETTYWSSPNTGADNSSGFVAVGAGYYGGAYYSRLLDGRFWTSAQASFYTNRAWHRYVTSGSAALARTWYNIESAYAVRCVKN